MKLLVLYLSLFLSLSNAVSQTRCTISGVASKSLNGKKVYLSKWDRAKKKIADDSVKIKNGKFSFIINSDKTKKYYLSYYNTKGKELFYWFITDTTEIRACVTDSTLEIKCYSHDILNSYKKKKISFFKGDIDRETHFQYGVELLNQLKKEGNIILRDQIFEELANDFTCNPNNAVFFSKLLLEGDSALLKNGIVKWAQHQLERLSGIDVYSGVQKYKDFVLYTLTGDSLKISDLIHKGKSIYVIVWASWCGPCIASIPEHIKKYETKREDVEFIHISIDDNVKKWEAAIKGHPVPWNQYILAPEKSKLFMQTYHFNGIPFHFYISKDGIFYHQNKFK